MVCIITQLAKEEDFGIAHPVPLFVKGFNKEKNEVIVCEENGLYQKEMIVEDVNWLLFDKLEGELEVTTKIRYASKPALAKICPVDENTVKVEFEEPQRGVTPGQSAVFYVDDVVVRRRKNCPDGRSLRTLSLKIHFL